MPAPTRIEVDGSRQIPSLEPDPRPAKARVGVYTDHTNPLQRLVSNPTRRIDRKEASAIWKAMAKGTDPHHFGHTLLDTRNGEERKASWPCRSETYTRHHIAWKEDGKHRRTYTLTRHTEHLTGAATDFFCGRAPSDATEFWQWALLDGDNHCDQFSKLVEIINRLFPELHPEPSTSGKGMHWVIKIHQWQRGVKCTDQDMHDKVISWCARIKAATLKLANGSYVELKGACCYWTDAGYKMGTLARLPVTLSSQQLETMAVIWQADFEDRLQKLERLAGIAPPAPHKEPSSPQGVTHAPELPAQDSSDRYDATNAFERMIHAKCRYVAQHKRLPADEEALCTYYEALNLNTGERTNARLTRARNVLDYARENWRPGGDTRVPCDPETLREQQEIISKYITPDAIKAAKGKTNRTTITTLELAAYQIIALELNNADDFSSRDKIMAVMNEWHEQGHLPRLINRHKMAMLRKLSIGSGFLVLTVKPNVATGTASSFAAGSPSDPCLVTPSSPQGVTSTPDPLARYGEMPLSEPEWDPQTVEEAIRSMEDAAAEARERVVVATAGPSELRDALTKATTAPDTGTRRRTRKLENRRRL